MSPLRTTVTAGVLVLAAACHHEAGAADQNDPATAAMQHGEEPAALGPHGQPLVHLEAAVVARLDLALARPEACTHQVERRAQARVVDDPAQRFTLRAPIAGRWIAPASGFAAAPGAQLAAGTDLGRVQPRLTASERADAAGRLAAARSDAVQAEAALDTSTKALARVAQLNSDDKSASDRAVEEARSRRAQDEARLAGARENARVLEGLLAPTADADAALPLRLARGGEVVELASRPGEEVDAGAALLSVADFSRARVRVDVPPPAAMLAPPAELRCRSVLAADAAWTARFVAVDADGTRASGAPAWIYAIEGDASGRLRPGVALEASIPAGELRSGWNVPDSAVVRLGGRAWVYLKAEDGAFERVPVVLDEPLAAGWFTRSDWAGGAELVVRGAQALLSTEIVGAESSAGAGEGD